MFALQVLSAFIDLTDEHPEEGYNVEELLDKFESTYGEQLNQFPSLREEF